MASLKEQEEKATAGESKYIDSKSSAQGLKVSESNSGSPGDDNASTLAGDVTGESKVLGESTESKEKRKRAPRAPQPPQSVDNTELIYRMGIMQGKLDALEQQRESQPAPQVVSLPAAPVVAIPDALRAYGMSSLDTKLYPTARQVKYIRDAQDTIRRSTGIAGSFIACDIKSPVFLPERVLEKNCMVDTKQGSDPDSLFEKFTEDVFRVKNESVAKNVSLSLSDLVNFLNRQFILAVVTGHCNAYGGPGSLLAYNFSLLSRTSAEKVATIIKTDANIRSYLQTLAVNGQKFDISQMSESVMLHYITTSREQMDAFFAEQKSQKEKLANPYAPAKRQHNAPRFPKPYHNHSAQSAQSVSYPGYPGSQNYNQYHNQFFDPAPGANTYYQYNQSAQPMGGPQGSARPYVKRDKQSRPSDYKYTTPDASQACCVVNVSRWHVLVSDLEIEGFASAKPKGLAHKNFDDMRYCRRQPSGL